MDEKGLFKKAFLLLKVLFCYLLIIFFITTIGRIADVYTSLAQVHGILGLLFLILLILPLLFLVWQIGSLWLRLPSAVRPPGPGLYAENPGAYTKKCLGFCRLAAENLMSNPNLDAGDRVVLQKALESMEQYAAQQKKIAPDELQMFWEKQTASLSSKLDGLAEKKISRSAVFTSLGTAASHNSAIDAVILIYQLIALTATIIQTYWTRPGIVVSFGLARDILMSAGGVILVSEITTGTYFKKLTKFINKVGDRIPGINIFTSILDEGVQAGVSWQMVRRYGKTVMRRCQAIEWDSSRERTALVAAVRQANEPADAIETLKIRHEVFELLRHFSWLEGVQDTGVAVCMFDYVSETFTGTRQMELFKKLRIKPVKDTGFLQKAMFWKKQESPFENFSRKACDEFLDIIKPLRANGFSLSEEQFIRQFQRS